MRSHHRIEWGGDVTPKTIAAAFSIGLCFYGMAFLLTYADRLEAPSLVRPAFAQHAAADRAVDNRRLVPDETADDACLSVDHWSCRRGC
jgi:hypothetical protein